MRRNSRKDWSKSVLLHLALGSLFLVPLGAREAWAASASDNDVQVIDETRNDNVFGGYDYNSTGSSSASRNKVTVTNSTVYYSYVYNFAGEGTTGTAKAADNTITINGASNIGYGVYNEAHVSNSEAATSTAELKGNAINVADASSVGGYAYNAAYVEGNGGGTAVADGNSITITDSSAQYDVYNMADVIGADGTATASSNTITISGSTVTEYSNYDIRNGVYNNAIVGGNGSVTAQQNKIEITGDSNVAAGYVHNGAYLGGNGTATVSDNKITVSDSSTAFGVYNEAEINGAGTTANTATTSGNTIDLTNATIGGFSYNGSYIRNSTGTATTKDNTINASGTNDACGIFNEAHVFAGGTADLSNNKITVAASSVVSDNIYSGAYGEGDNATAKSSGNSIAVTDSQAQHSVFDIAKSFTAGDATVDSSTLEVTNSKVGTSNDGGAVYNVADGAAGTAAISNNEILVTNSDIGKMNYEHRAEQRFTMEDISVFSGALSDEVAQATNNKITLVNSNTTGVVEVASIGCADNKTIEAKGNTINILQNSTVTGVGNMAMGLGEQDNVIASDNIINIEDSTVTRVVMAGEAQGMASSSMTSANNTVNIRGTVDLTQADIYGGVMIDFNTRIFTMGTNNTLNMYSKDVTAKSVGYFNNYNFYLPAGTKAGDSILTLTDGATDLTGATVDVKGVADDFNLNVGEKVNLISNANGVTVDAAQPTTATATKGIALDYDLGLDYDANNVYATIKGVHANERTKSFLEGRLGTSLFVNKGADLLGDNDILGKLAPDKKYEGIAELEYGNTKGNTGSSVEVQGLNMLLGFGKAVDSGKGTLRWAPFIEAGWGSYNTKNDFLNYASVNGKGDTDYYGVGFMAKKLGESGNYIEGSIRAGRVGDDYSSDLRYNGEGAEYDITTTYYGAHIGIGKLIRKDNHSWDIFAKYFYNKVKGDDATIFGTDYSFDDTTSNRLKIGTKYTKDISANNSWFGGLAWEYEMSGSAQGTVSGYDIASPDYKGSTGVVTAGYTYTPTDKKYDVNFSLSERFGKRHGVSGRVECLFKI